MNKNLRTEQTEEILKDKAFCRALAVHKRSFKALLYQIQLSITTEDNRDTVGPTILALREIHDIFEDVIIHGEALIVEEEKKTKKSQ